MYVCVCVGGHFLIWPCDPGSVPSPLSQWDPHIAPGRFTVASLYCRLAEQVPFHKAQGPFSQGQALGSYAKPLLAWIPGVLGRAHGIGMLPALSLASAGKQSRGGMREARARDQRLLPAVSS